MPFSEHSSNESSFLNRVCIGGRRPHLLMAHSALRSLQEEEGRRKGIRRKQGVKNTRDKEGGGGGGGVQSHSKWRRLQFFA